MSNTVGKSITRTFAAALIMALVGLTSVTADAQMRMVIVNGQMLMPQELALLDQLSGGYVPNGAYWLNMQTGVWGYAGDPTPRGQIGGGAANGGGGRAPNYSGALDRGPFGTYMSDGNCSFVNGVPVGNCG